MSYQVLARKWRPQNFNEVIGQDHIVKSLSNQITSNTLGHAFLFSGTRGVGKTSMARILAKAIRCENKPDSLNPCNKCSSCEDTLNDSSMDVLEIDGASNNSVDNVREIIESSKFLPVVGTKRVFIIDEVHMLSGSAFNALLKTLEEPPAHVVFIFATTEPEKLPATVLSRCQKYDFLDVSIDSLMAQVKFIAREESIRFENDSVLRKICQHGEGSVRDTLTLLEQALMYSTDKYIDNKLIETSLGIIQEESVEKILRDLFVGDSESLKEVCSEIKNSRVKVDHLVLEIGKVLHRLILENTIHRDDELVISLGRESINTSKSEMIWLFDIFSKEGSLVVESVFPFLSLEILLIKLSLRRDILKNIGIKINGSSESTESNKEKARSVEEVKTQALLAIQETESENENISSKFEKEEILEDLSQSLSASIEVEKIAEVPATEAKDEESSVNEVNVVNEKNWAGFLEDLSASSPATASNLEQGNILGRLIFEEEKSLQIILGFSSESEVFYDYISEKTSKEKILQQLSRYFKIDIEKINFELKLLETDEKERIGFSSIVEIDEKKRLEEVEKKRTKLLADELIIEAQGLFNAEIDKTVIQ